MLSTSWANLLFVGAAGLEPTRLSDLIYSQASQPTAQYSHLYFWQSAAFTNSAHRPIIWCWREFESLFNQIHSLAPKANTGFQHRSKYWYRTNPTGFADQPTHLNQTCQIVLPPGLEPGTLSLKVRYSSQLSYESILVTQTGLKPVTSILEGLYSIHLSYWAITFFYFLFLPLLCLYESTIF